MPGDSECDHRYNVNISNRCIVDVPHVRIYLYHLLHA